MSETAALILVGVCGFLLGAVVTIALIVILAVNFGLDDDGERFPEDF